MGQTPDQDTSPLTEWKGASPTDAAPKGSLSHHLEMPPRWVHVDRFRRLHRCPELWRGTAPPPQQWQARGSEDRVRAWPSAPLAGKVIPSQVKEKAPQPKIAALPSCHTV